MSTSNGEAKNNTAATGKKRGRWDQTVEEHFLPAKKQVTSTTPTSWEAADVIIIYIYLKTILYYIYFVSFMCIYLFWLLHLAFSDRSEMG